MTTELPTFVAPTIPIEPSSDPHNTTIVPAAVAAVAAAPPPSYESVFGSKKRPREDNPRFTGASAAQLRSEDDDLPLPPPSVHIGPALDVLTRILAYTVTKGQNIYYIQRVQRFWKAIQKETQ